MALLELLEASGRQGAALGQAEHRPWPAPSRPWLLGQTWSDLLFAHWRVPAEALRPLVPEPLELDSFDGSTWLAISPFSISDVRLRGTLPPPLLSSLLEVNVRTYVSAGGKPGIWFLSLDASSSLAVQVGRRLYGLPYHRARMRAAEAGGRIDYGSSRRGAHERPFVLEVRYRPAGEVFTAAPGSLEHFLTERYCLYSGNASRLLRAEIHHPPWPLQRAEVEMELNTLAPDGLEPDPAGALLHFAARQDVVVWAPERAGA